MSDPPSPRRFRLQFSLRALLVLMALVPVGIVAYRWPWVEEQSRTQALLDLDPASEAQLLQRDFPANYERLSLKSYWGRELIAPSDDVPLLHDLRRRTTYCRGWDGSIVQHGLEQFWNTDGVLRLEEWFVDGERRQSTCYSVDHSSRQTTTFINGRLHGRALFQVGPRTWEGNLHDGKRSGRWQMTFRDRGETVVAQLAYENDRAHGEWTWANGRGEVLQSARFEQGQLVQWNGRTVSEELARWREQQQVDPRMNRLLASRYKALRLNDRELNIANYFAFGQATRVLPATGNEHLLLYSSWPEPHYDFLDLAASPRAPDREVTGGIIEGALLSSRTMVYRFDQLCIVPICAHELKWEDQTGVTRVRFPERSFQAAYWDQLRAGTIPHGATPDYGELENELRELFRESGIELDLSRLVQEPSFTRGPRIPADRRLRRNILGVLLASRGWSCEQQGNTLVLHPHPQIENRLLDNKP